MSVTSQTPYKKYTAAPGATVFATTFRVVLASDLKVTVDGVVVTSGFTLSTLGVPVGLDVTFTTPMVGGEIVEFQRIIPKSRTNDYQQLGDFNAAVVNADMDRLWMSNQELGEEVDRAVKVPIGSTIDPDQLIADLLAVEDAANDSADDAAAAASAAAAAALAAQAAAGSVNLPSIVGKALNFLRVNAAALMYEHRTAGQVRGDIGAESFTQDFRLTLTTGLPVTTADVTGATTIYATPKTGKYIDLFDGTNWNRRASAEFSLALGTLTSGRPYDVFCYDNAGVPTLEFTAWTNDSTRATALALQDGVLVKSGAVTRRYLGTFYTTATTTTEDSMAKRYLWNYYHRVRRSMFKGDATTTWVYSTAVYRQARATATNQLEWVVGVAEDSIDVFVQGQASCNVANQGYETVGVGLDSTTVNSAQIVTEAIAAQDVRISTTAYYTGVPAAGRHFAAWLERTNISSNTHTWYGAANQMICGIRGTLFG